MSEATDAVFAAIEPAFGPLGLELLDVELTGAGRTRTLRVVIDRDGGVDLDAITAASEAISPRLDRDPSVVGRLQGPYTLEVSSPGVERKLRTPAQFRRVVGGTVSVKRRDAAGVMQRHRGALAAADDEGITVVADDGEVRVQYGDLVEARTVFEWGPSPRPGKARARTGQGVVS